MNIATLSKLFAITSAAILIGGCSGNPSSNSDEDGNDVSTEEALKANVTPGTFKLYTKAHATPNTSCDLYTKLDLKSAFYSTAVLEEVVSGFCEIAVVPNKRTYRLKLDSTSCGTRVYTGSLTKSGVRTEIKITDNRARTCKDLVSAKVIVEEKKNGTTTKKYSYDGAEAITVWPSDAKTLVAQTKGGGFTPQPPAGSTCAFGAQKYTLDVATKKVAWEVCEFKDWSTPLTTKSGTTTLNAANYASVIDAINEVTVSSSPICGADKPLLTISVTSTSQGTKTYKDSFYSCQGDGTYVDNIDGVFSAFGDATGH